VAAASQEALVGQAGEQVNVQGHRLEVVV